MVKLGWYNIVGVILVVILFSAQQDASQPEVQDATQPTTVQAVSQSGTVPESVRRPDQISDPSFPRDLSIGELGAGSASTEAYKFARRVLGEAQQNKADSALLAAIPQSARKEFLEQVTSIEPRKLRVGGGQDEVDGSTSFVFRFIGREKELAGEIYIRASGINRQTTESPPEFVPAAAASAVTAASTASAAAALDEPKKEGTEAAQPQTETAPVTKPAAAAISAPQGSWKLEDIIPENPRDINEARESDHPYSWTPYNRFW